MSNLTAVGWALQPLKRYADFSGRSPRREYWWFILLQVVAIYVPFGILLAAGGENGRSAAGMIFIVVAVMAVFIPSVAVQVRRFHDQDKSGWFVLLAFIPYIGGLIMIIFMCLRGTEGDNRFGPDPYMDDHLHEVFA